MVAQVIVKLVNEQFMGEFYLRPSQEATARSLQKDGWYRNACECFMQGVGEDLAEEMFDLTNNPGRQEEREQVYGRQRSISVGDIVEVNGVNYLCASMGWKEIA
jgi:hypothetical protein